MAKPNYKQEKRARELAKKQKKEDKLKRRQEHAASGHDPEATGDAPADTPGEESAPDAPGVAGTDRP